MVWQIKDDYDELINCVSSVQISDILLCLGIYIFIYLQLSSFAVVAVGVWALY